MLVFGFGAFAGGSLSACASRLRGGRSSGCFSTSASAISARRGLRFRPARASHGSRGSPVSPLRGAACRPGSARLGRIAAATAGQRASRSSHTFWLFPPWLSSAWSRSEEFRAPQNVLRDPVPWILGALWLGIPSRAAATVPGVSRLVVPLVWGYYLDLGGLGPSRGLLLPRIACAICLLAPLLWLAFRHTPAPGVAQSGLPRILGCRTWRGRRGGRAA